MRVRGHVTQFAGGSRSTSTLTGKGRTGYARRCTGANGYCRFNGKPDALREHVGLIHKAKSKP